MGRGSNWTTAQDQALCRAWIEVSEDVLVGTGQNARRFWSRILEAYTVSSGGDTRSERAITARWNVIAPSVSKFVGCYEQAEAHVSSGMVEEDVMKVALESYAVDHPKNHAFEFTECWNILKTIPKWQQQCGKSNEKSSLPTQNPSDFSSPSSDEAGIHVQRDNIHSRTPTPFDGEVRPSGYKKARRAMQGSRMADVLADQLKTQNRLQEERGKILELTCGAFMFSLREDQIPENSRQYYNLAKKKLWTSLEKSESAGEVPLASCEQVSNGNTSPFATVPDDQDMPDENQANIGNRVESDNDGYFSDSGQGEMYMDGNHVHDRHTEGLPSYVPDLSLDFSL